MTFSVTDLAAVEAHLSTNHYLSGADKPGKVDADFLTQLRESKTVPSASTHSNLYGWYSFVCLFTPDALKLWTAVAPVAAAAVAPAAAAKPAAKTDDVDLFGDDDDEEDEAAAKELAEKKRKEAEAAKDKKKKEKPVAKTIIVFEVKVFEEEENLDELAKKIFATINPDGLVWNTNYQLIPVAYGMKKLSIGMVVEDDKIMTDDIFEQILSWEDQVQSVDISNMQKV